MGRETERQPGQDSAARQCGAEGGAGQHGPSRRAVLAGCDPGKLWPSVPWSGESVVLLLVVHLQVRLECRVGPGSLGQRPEWRLMNTAAAPRGPTLRAQLPSSAPLTCMALLAGGVQTQLLPPARMRFGPGWHRGGAGALCP